MFAQIQRIALPAIRARLCRLWVIVVMTALAFAIATLAAAPVFFAKDKDEEVELGPGCAPGRPAIAHHAGGVIADTDRDEKAPIPCATRTGFPTGEPSIVVTNAGTVLFQPNLESDTTGLPVGVLRSVDRGETWQFIDPTTPARTSGADMNMDVGRRTGRVFWSSDLATRRLDHSDDDGQTWIPSLLFPATIVGFDHTQVFAGPPPENLKHLMQGYPNVVYVVVAGGAATSENLLAVIDYGECLGF